MKTASTRVSFSELDRGFDNLQPCSRSDNKCFCIRKIDWVLFREEFVGTPIQGSEAGATISYPLRYQCRGEPRKESNSKISDKNRSEAAVGMVPRPDGNIDLS